MFTWIDENMDSIHKWLVKSSTVLEELKKKESTKFLKNHCGEGASLGFRNAKGRDNINYALFAGSNAIQDQLAGEEELWEKLWTRDKEVDIQKELGGVT